MSNYREDKVRKWGRARNGADSQYAEYEIPSFVSKDKFGSRAETGKKGKETEYMTQEKHKC